MKKNANNPERYRAMEHVRRHNELLQFRRGVQPSAYIHSFGCQQNVADGETLGGLLLEMGYTFSPRPQTADVVLYNTCGVRENAENTVFGNIGELKHAKFNNPEMIIGLCGCMTQQKQIANKIKSSYPHVDIVFGAGAMDKFPEILMEAIENGNRVFKIDDPTTDIVENLPVLRNGKIKAFVPIMSGCNNFCSYCIVPYVRGRERSRNPENILEEITQLVSEGYKEITLLGQNVNSYGKELKESYSFSQLLKNAAEIPGEFRIRFMTAHPKDCTKELLDIMASYEKISKHIHLPVQSGSNRVLELMNRKYSIENYMGLVEYGKQIMPEMAFTSDIIIGFPGETEQDFQKTFDIVMKVGYSALFTFAYSPRSGTKAAEMEDQLTHAEKTNRFERLLSLQRNSSNAFNRKHLGETVKVLVEDHHRSREGFLVGRTDTNVMVIFEANREKIGEFIDIKVTKYMDWALEGELL